LTLRENILVLFVLFTELVICDFTCSLWSLLGYFLLFDFALLARRLEGLLRLRLLVKGPGELSFVFLFIRLALFN
jgi:hypothetical protein